MPRFIGARCGVNSTWAAEVLLDLGRVAVVEQAVGVEVLVDGAERVVGLGGPAGAGDAAGGVDDEPGALDEPGVEQRGEGERRRRDVAAGRGDEPGADELLAVPLGQAVHGLGEQLGWSCSKPYHCGYSEASFSR